MVAGTSALSTKLMEKQLEKQHSLTTNHGEVEGSHKKLMMAET